MSRYVLTFPGYLSDVMMHRVRGMAEDAVIAFEEGKVVVLEGGAMLYDLDSPFPGHALMAMLEKNERDRELSPVLSWGDGRPMTRIEWERERAKNPQYVVGFYGEPVEDAA